MYFQKHSSVILTIFLWIHIVVSELNLKKVNDPYDIWIAKKLVKYIDKKIKDAALEEIKYDHKTKIKPLNLCNEDKTITETSDGNKFKKLVVKRISPHVSKATKAERNSKYNYFYRNLDRTLKRRPSIATDGGNKIFNPTDKKEMLKQYMLPISYIQKLLNLKGKHIFRLEPFRIDSESHQNYEDAKDYLDFLIKYMNSKGWGQNKSQKSDPLLRSPIYLNPEQLYRDELFEATTKKPKWLPKYPAWNFWTYKKTIYQDECPGTQTNVGGYCIWIPPH